MNRQFERKNVSVRIFIEEEELKGNIWFSSEDMSNGGVYLVSDFLLEKGTNVALMFSLPGSDRELVIRSRVAWVNLGLEPTMKARPPGMGIEFSELPDDTLKALENYLANQ